VARFEVIPAIDLLGSRCVRLSHGRYEAVTVYDDDPAGVAGRFAAHGVPRLHVVDLDGAKQGRPSNSQSVRRIVESAAGVPVQLGGGIRGLEAVEEAFELGVSRVVLGTIALRDPELVREAARRHPDRVAVEAWLETSETTAPELARRFEAAGVAAIVHTDIARDGMLSGPNLEASAEVADAVSIPVIVSGGVASEDDVARASEYLERGISGAIVGRALYTGAVDLGRALSRVACS
jgi:phosphoribosylformimino-5-aminoimidazole carboxamide ribotide isomerase